MTVSLRYRLDGDEAVIEVTGEIDIATSGDLRRMVTGAVAVGAESVTLDCSDMTFMDSSGIAVLLEVAGRLADLGGSMTVKNPTRNVRRVLEITGLDSQVTIA